MHIYKAVEPDQTHDPADLRDLITAATLGDRIERTLLDRTNPFSLMMEKAREDFLTAQLSLIAADLNTPAGIDSARSAQRNARHYVDLCNYIAEAFETAASAIQQLEGEEEEQAVEDLKDMIYGSERAKPAPDA
jgi:hypothetical protein